MNSFSFTSLVNRFRSGMYRDPVRDWLVLLTLAILTFASLVVWNIWAFETVAQGGVIGANIATTTPDLNRSSIDAIHGIFEKRAVEEAKFVTGVYRFSDPSQ